MSESMSLPSEVAAFPHSGLRVPVEELGARYRAARPVPHIYLEGVLEQALARAAMLEFPRPDSDAWTHYQHQNENKHGMTRRSLFPPSIGEATDALNSPAFLAWLAELTGIAGLMADPMLEGGGLHQSGPGGYLNVHTDFSHHHYHKNWKRRINLILYLNEDWNPDWGGGIELWDPGMRHCMARYPPQLNSALIFNTNDISYHGFPEPLTCPQGQSRKSLAFYYYTLESGGAKTAVRSTNYRARPGDGALKSGLIWLDKKAVGLYSHAKATFGFSDDLMSRLLGRLSGRRR
jgi:Rps23 Pro-64 3,4-dihydroxylase Tpa1-like proline 4-hydroxylase